MPFTPDFEVQCVGATDRPMCLETAHSTKPVMPVVETPAALASREKFSTIRQPPTGGSVETPLMPGRMSLTNGGFLVILVTCLRDSTGRMPGGVSAPMPASSCTRMTIAKLKG